MSNVVRGIVHSIGPTQTYGSKGFRKRQVVLEQEIGTFTNYVPIDVIRDMCDEIDDIRVGDDVKFAFRLSGRKWQKDDNSEVRYFLSAEAMSFELLSNESTSEEHYETPF